MHDTINLNSIYARQVYRLNRETGSSRCGPATVRGASPYATELSGRRVSNESKPGELPDAEYR